MATDNILSFPDKPKVVDLRPNYTLLLRSFGRDAVNRMGEFTRSNGHVDYETLYAFVFSVRMAIQCLDTTDGGNLQAFKQFCDQYDAAASKMYARLNQLRAEAEEHADEPF